MAGNASGDGSRLIGASESLASDVVDFLNAGTGDANDGGAIDPAPIATGPASVASGGTDSDGGIAALSRAAPVVGRIYRDEPAAAIGTDNGTAPSSVAGIGSGTAGDEFERDANGNVVIGATGQPRRKRGRKAGSAASGTGTASANRPANSANLKTSIDRLATNIGIIHIGLAAVTKTPELELSDTESKALASATANVMEQFATEIDPRVTAIVGLITTAGSIYGPRVFLVRQRKSIEAAQLPVELPTGENAPTPENPAGATLYEFGRIPK